MVILHPLVYFIRYLVIQEHKKNEGKITKKKYFFHLVEKNTFLFHMSKKIFLKKKTKKTQAVLSSAEIHQWFPSTFSIPLTN